MSAVTGFIAAGAIAFTPIEVDGLFIDGFAGGGGASTGIEQAIGRSVDIAINHSETAIAIHRANHPGTEHHCTDIRMPFLPQQTTRGRYVAGAWFSPDCKEFSKAKGGPVKDRSIRALCWEVVTWLKDTQPTCGYLENVEEFEYAAPLDADGHPIAGQEGREFRRFVRAIRAFGYRVRWKILVASKYGAPTSRKRLYMVMRNDGKPIVWPKQTHGAPDSPGVRSGKLLPYRTAAECIDWSIECPSIFERRRELAEATKRRIAHGVMRYAVNAGVPFLVPAANDKAAAFVTYGQHGGRNRSLADPSHTIAASTKDTNGVVTAFLQSFYGSDKAASGGDPLRPLRTVRASGQHHAIVAAHIEQANTGMVGHDARKPLSTIVGKGCTQRIIETTLVEEGALAPEVMERATRTAAFLVKYYGTNGENETSQVQAADRPLDVVTVKARFAVVTVTIDARTYVIVDIGMRMLTPRELARCQGFPDSYILNPVVRKFLRSKWVDRELTIAEQISAIGNSVCPPVARALVAANQPGREALRLAA